MLLLLLWAAGAAEEEEEPEEQEEGRRLRGQQLRRRRHRGILGLECKKKEEKNAVYLNRFGKRETGEREREGQKERKERETRRALPCFFFRRRRRVLHRSLLLFQAFPLSLFLDLVSNFALSSSLPHPTMAVLATASKACAAVRSTSARAAPVASVRASSSRVAVAAAAAPVSSLASRPSSRLSSAVVAPAAGRRSVATAAASNGGLAIDLRGELFGCERSDCNEKTKKAIERGPLVFFFFFWWIKKVRKNSPLFKLFQTLLTGKKAFIAGVADDQGFGWAIAKALAEAGCEISLGVWVRIFFFFFWRSNKKTTRGGERERSD